MKLARRKILALGAGAALLPSHIRSAAADTPPLLAERLAEACLGDARVERVLIRIEQPEALAPDAAAAGVEIGMKRA